MVHREIEIDDDTDRLLTDLASEYGGNISSAVAELVRARANLEDFADQSEAAHGETLRALRDRSETDYSERRTVTWEDVKSRNHL